MRPMTSELDSFNQQPHNVLTHTGSAQPVFCGSTQLIRVGIERERVHVRYIVNNETDDKEYQGHDKTELQAEVGCFPKFCKFFHYNFPPYQP